MLSIADWEKLEALFHQACTLPPDEWDDFIVERAGHDPQLSDELQGMLKAAEQATVRLRVPLQQAAERLMYQGLAEGTRCGPWAVDRQIGGGGMGRVYLGHRADGVYDQQVAIKLLANRSLDPLQQKVFQFECRLQAKMQHPAIAQIHDAGVHPEAGPYLVMEYIDGKSIDQWCNAHQVGIDERIEFFIQVCHGVQHAHQKGVIHRDLKPGNILVTERDGRRCVKVIDFGIALGGADDHTKVFPMGTPGYMSPEQVRCNEDIDVRSDVYALGVLLHVLLSGQKASAEMRNFSLLSLSPGIREKAAAILGRRPAVFRRMLENGLDAIVVRATEADRARRYSSVAGIINDLERWQKHLLPVGMIAPWQLRGRQMVRRHWLPLSAASVVLLALFAGFTASLWSLAEARAQQAEAHLRGKQLERTVNFQTAMLEGVNVDTMGHAIESSSGVPAQDIARDLLENHVVAHALETVERDFADDSVLANELRQSLAKVLMGIGRYEAAERELHKVLAGLRDHGGSDVQIMSAMLDLGDALYAQGDFHGAQEQLSGMLPDALGVSSRNPLWLRAGALHGRVQLAQGQMYQALDMQLRLEKTWSQWVDASSEDLLSLQMDIVRTQTRLSQRDQALAGIQRLLPRLVERFGSDDPRTLAGRMIMAELLNTANEYERSLALAQDVRWRRTQQLGSNHPATLQAMALEGANQVRLAQDEEAWEQADIFLKDLQQRQQHILGKSHPDTLQTVSDAVRLLGKQGHPQKLEEAIALQRQLLAARTAAQGAEHPDTLTAYASLASLLARTARYDEAKSAARKALDGYRQVMPEHASISAIWDVLGRIENNAGRLDAAREAHANALALRIKRHGSFDAHSTESASRLYSVLARQGESTEMQRIRRTYLDPVIAADPQLLNAGQQSVREEAMAAVAEAERLEQRAEREIAKR